MLSEKAVFCFAFEENEYYGKLSAFQNRNKKVQRVKKEKDRMDFRRFCFYVLLDSIA
jgi:hypothetical protein